jgi:hypothetical protein
MNEAVSTIKSKYKYDFLITQFTAQVKLKAVLKHQSFLCINIQTGFPNNNQILTPITEHILIIMESLF